MLMEKALGDSKNTRSVIVTEPKHPFLAKAVTTS